MSPLGVCAVERSFPMPTYTVCSAALKAARVESAASAPVQVTQATAIDIYNRHGAILLCKPK